MGLSPAEHPPSIGVLEDLDADVEGALQAEALTLRTELRRADARLQAAIADESAVRLAMRAGEERHRAWFLEKEEAIAKLRKDNGRLERSAQQAALEERRLADVVRAEPERTEQVLMRLQSECHRLEKENQRLESDTANIKAELSSVRDVVTTRRNCRQPTRSTHPTAQRAKAKQ
jgi:chromosome segregation ATPase